MEMNHTVIHALATEMNLPEPEVERVYAAELDRLTRNSRVRGFLPILAARGTRDVLRQRPLADAPSSKRRH
jgi:hypothetical protein